MSVAERIRERLQSLEPLRLELEDLSERHRGHAGWREGGETHWRLAIVSARFAGLAPVARHRLVYSALGDLMSHPVHAIEISAYGPGEPGANANSSTAR